jgi:toxin ParE1/3/4
MGVSVGLGFSMRARKDLLDIARYIARDNPQCASTFVIDLRLQCVLLSKQSGLGAIRTDLADNLRMLPYGRYLIFFSENEFGILVERVLHSARNLSSLFNNPSDFPLR